jgi:uncharacterized tellurite resistance protein B-like protein
MIKQFISQVVDALSAPPADREDQRGRDAALRSATAVLMLDVARSDSVFDETEFERVLGLVEKHFGMSPEDAAELVNAADEKAEELVSLHEFTQLLHNNLDEDEKACCGRSPMPTAGSTSMKIRSCARSATCCT